MTRDTEVEEVDMGSSAEPQELTPEIKAIEKKVVSGGRLTRQEMASWADHKRMQPGAEGPKTLIVGTNFDNLRSPLKRLSGFIRRIKI